MLQEINGNAQFFCELPLVSVGTSLVPTIYFLFVSNKVNLINFICIDQSMLLIVLLNEHQPLFLLLLHLFSIKELEYS